MDSNRQPAPGPPTWRVRTVSALAIAGICFYVVSWALAGLWWPGYDATSRAISELFAIGAPAPGRILLTAALAVSGVVLLPFPVVLHRRLPGDAVAGPVAAFVSGVGTVAIVFFPCTAGCPGAATSFTDLAHTVTAGVAYAALIAAPLLFAGRLRGRDPVMFTASLVLGGVAAVGFLLRGLGIGDPVAGLLQRTFNTLADAWYVVAAAVIIHRSRGTGRLD